MAERPIELPPGLEGALRLAIYRLLEKNAFFDPEAVKAMTTAYEAILRSLKLSDRSDPMTEIIAKRIIDVAKTGQRDPELIQRSVLIGLQ